MDVSGDDRESSLSGYGGDPCIVDRNRCASFFEFEPHRAVGMGHITVDRHDFNAAQIGMKPVGVTPVVPRLADAKLELAEDDRRNHHLGAANGTSATIFELMSGL
jgi:hypothetical protein